MPARRQFYRKVENTVIEQFQVSISVKSLYNLMETHFFIFKLNQDEYDLHSELKGKRAFIFLFVYILVENINFKCCMRLYSTCFYAHTLARWFNWTTKLSLIHAYLLRATVFLLSV